MKLLVTGGLGFIGSNFILKVLEENTDIQITNVDAELAGSNKKNLSSVEKNKNYEFVKGNITNRRLMEKLITNCDSVINFAAESFVDRSIYEADPFLVSNIRGAFTILDIITKQKKQMIQISTDEIFGSILNGNADEGFKFNPSNPYAATKASAELLVDSYHKTFDSNVIITRCTNNFGPRQFPEKLIPKIILLAKLDKNIPIYGSGKNIRDWIYVDEHCDAIFRVLMKGQSGQSYNISGNTEISNLQITNYILEKMNKSKDLIKFVDDRPGHDFRYSLDSTKISNELGWKNKLSFEEGLKQTIEWYQKNSEIYDSISPKILQTDTPWR